MMMIGIFLENLIFTRALGSSMALLVARNKISIVIFGTILTLITVVASVIVWFAGPFIDKQNANIKPLIFIVIIAIVYIVALLIVSNCFSSKLKKTIISIIHLSAFNSAVFGALLLGNNIYKSQMDLSGYIGLGLGVGIGFTLAIFLIYIAYDYLYSTRIPKAFRGFPIMLLYIGIISLAFYGLVGHKLPL